MLSISKMEHTNLKLSKKFRLKRQLRFHTEAAAPFLTTTKVLRKCFRVPVALCFCTFFFPLTVASICISHEACVTEEKE